MRIAIIASLAGMLLSVAAYSADAPSAAAAPGSPGTYLSAQQLSDVLKASIAAGAEPALAQISNTNQYVITQVHRAKAANAAVHPGWTEVHLILAGSGTFVTGGTLKTSGTSKSIEGGTSRKVVKGDVIIVPADSPHQYTTIDGSLDAIEVRFIAPAAKP